ncbi:MAG: amino acid ABC transporter permease [Chloroflexi bacterium]|nr:amino acid ABC transporter permease [Chloroflexota bacterium]
MDPPGAPRLPPPREERGIVGWLRHNLFRTWRDSIVSVVLLVIIGLVVVQLLEWALLSARWGVITQNLRLFLIGLYPADEAWRVWLSLTVVSVVAGAQAGTRGGYSRTIAVWLIAGQLTVAILALLSPMGPLVAAAIAANAGLTLVVQLATAKRPLPGRVLTIGWLVSLVATLVLLHGGAGIPVVRPDAWGGLLLTFMLASVSIVLSFPLGVALALGRRSRLPAIRLLATAFIEIVRGVPLVSILYLSSILLPLFLPGDLRIDQVVRAMGGMTLFTAAYLAENVRGGLQAVPRGQVEAAQAIGLSGVQIDRFIVLPQALRMTIPANVGLFISLLKDTTLVVIVSLLEILGIGRAVLAQAEWLGASFEVYAFIAIVFFVLSYSMAHASYRLEAALGVGRR